MTQQGNEPSTTDCKADIITLVITAWHQCGSVVVTEAVF